MLNQWFTEEVSIKLIKVKDQYDKIVETEEITKKVKKEQMVQYKMGPQGNQIIVQTTYYMNPDERIREGDLIEDRPILLISEMRDHRGRLMLWEVFA
jgi:hypothetical protein